MGYLLYKTRRSEFEQSPAFPDKTRTRKENYPSNNSFIFSCMCIRCRGNVYAEALPRNHIGRFLLRRLAGYGDKQTDAKDL
jgi:hypothetical protein